MSVDSIDGEKGEGQAPKKPWKKPSTLSFAIRDHTQDGYITGNDAGSPPGSFTKNGS